MTALTPSRHNAGSPIPLDGATPTAAGGSACGWTMETTTAPLAASAPDTVAGAAQ